MNTIKFSHDYVKLPASWEGTTARLLSICEIELGKLPAEFIVCDTLYYDDSGVGGNFPLPAKGNFLLLLFFPVSGPMFTTLRRSTPSKKKYYESRVGEDFVLEKGGRDPAIGCDCSRCINHACLCECHREVD